MRGMPIRLTTHNIGTVESIANVLFLAGERRYACEDSSFMFHGVGFNVGARARFEMKHLRERIDSVESDQRKIARILTDRTRLDPQIVDGLFDEAVNRDPQYALDHGIIDGIEPVQVPAGSPMRQLRLKD